MATPTDRQYSKTHEWIKLEGNRPGGHHRARAGSARRHHLRRPPKVGVSVKKDAACGVIESVKAASDINAPASGQVTEVNRALETAPEEINADP